MNMNLKKTAPAGTPTKGELLRTLHALAPRRAPAKAAGSGKALPGKTAQGAPRKRRSQAATCLLRRYFALQIAQITGHAG